VGVEPTTLAAKASVNGFEGHEDHRTLFASRDDGVLRIRSLAGLRNSVAGEMTNGGALGGASVAV
jgi:hypothetical protein